jgi:fibronectin type 3 domain-containing protein
MTLIKRILLSTLMITGLLAFSAISTAPPVSAAPLGAPNPPTAFAGLPANAGAFLTWTPPVNPPGITVTYYDVFMSTTSGTETYLFTTSLTHVTAQGLTNGELYYFYVEAANSNGFSDPSNEISVTPSPVPNPPSPVTATAKAGSVALTWGQATPNPPGGAITSYQVYQGTTSFGEGSVPVATVYGLSTTITGLSNATTYYFYVTSSNNIGESQPSAEVNATPSATPYPPTQLQATPGDSTAFLSWNAPDPAAGAVNSYLIYQGTTPGGESATAVATSVTTSVQITGLTNGTTYYFKVRANTSAGLTGPSNEANARPAAGAAPPIGLSAVAGNTTVALSWSPPLSGAPVTGYQVFYATSLSVPIATISALATGYTVTGLTNGVTYSFVVVSMSTTGNSQPSNIATGTPQGSSGGGGGGGGGYPPPGPPAATGGTKVSANPSTCGAPPFCGYIVLISGRGDLGVFGAAPYYGSMYGKPLNAPMVAVTYTPDGKGYWEVASDGGVFTYGAAGYYGSMGNKRLNSPITGIAPTHDGRGYWLVAADGGIFAFGDATFYGSMGAIRLNQPIVSIATTPDGLGYWEVASDGGIFSFGDAGFHGSMGGVRLNQPVVGLTPTPDGKGYWEVASDGGIFNFGDALFAGSAVGQLQGQLAVGMYANSDKAYNVISATGLSDSLS